MKNRLTFFKPLPADRLNAIRNTAMAAMFCVPGEATYALDQNFLGEIESISRSAVQNTDCASALMNTRDAERRFLQGNLSELTTAEMRQQIVRIAVVVFIIGYAHAREKSDEMATVEIIHLCRENPEKPLVKLFIDDLPIE